MFLSNFLYKKEESDWLLKIPANQNASTSDHPISDF